MTAGPPGPTEPGAIVEFHKLKWPSSLKLSHRVTVLGTDEYGLWVGGPAGEPFRLVEGGIWVADADSVACIDQRRNWNSWFIDEPRKQIYLDVFENAHWENGRYAFVDLDLDVVGLEQLEVGDMEELELHSQLYNYPAELIERAWNLASQARREAT